MKLINNLFALFTLPYDVKVLYDWPHKQKGVRKENIFYDTIIDWEMDSTTRFKIENKNCYKTFIRLEPQWPLFNPHKFIVTD